MGSQNSKSASKTQAEQEFDERVAEHFECEVLVSQELESVGKCVCREEERKDKFESEFNVTQFDARDDLDGTETPTECEAPVEALENEQDGEERVVIHFVTTPAVTIKKELTACQDEMINKANTEVKNVSETISNASVIKRESEAIKSEEDVDEMEEDEKNRENVDWVPKVKTEPVIRSHNWLNETIVTRKTHFHSLGGMKQENSSVDGVNKFDDEDYQSLPEVKPQSSAAIEEEQKWGYEEWTPKIKTEPLLCSPSPLIHEIVERKPFEMQFTWMPPQAILHLPNTIKKESPSVKELYEADDTEDYQPLPEVETQPTAADEGGKNMENTEWTPEIKHELVLYSPSPVSQEIINTKPSEMQFTWIPRQTPFQLIDAIKEESPSVEEVVENNNTEDYQSLVEMETQPIVPEIASPKKITILENILIINPSPNSSAAGRKRKNVSSNDARNRPKQCAMKKVKTPELGKKRKLQYTENKRNKERQLQQKKENCNSSNAPPKKRGRPSGKNTEANRRLWIEKLFRSPQEQDLKKKKVKKVKRRSVHIAYSYKLPKNTRLEPSEVVTRSKTPKLTARICVASDKSEPANVCHSNTTNIEQATTLSFPKPFKTDPNHYELSYPIAEKLPQPILLELPVDDRTAKIKAELLSKTQPMVRLRRVPVERLRPSRDGGFFVPNEVRRLLEKKTNVPQQFKKQKTASTTPENNTVESDVTPQLRIKNVFSFNPVVRLKRFNPFVRDEIAIKTELSEEEPPAHLPADSPAPQSSSSAKGEVSCDNDDSGISINDCDAQSDALLMSQIEVLNMALDEGLLLEIATQRAHINNCLLKFGFSPIQFHLYNSIEELNVFLGYLLID